MKKTNKCHKGISIFLTRYAPKKHKSGFTLIELMVVIAIVALLSSIVLASIKTAREKAQITKTVAEMKSLQNALELYRNQFEKYPGKGIQLIYDDDKDAFLLKVLVILQIGIRLLKQNWLIKNYLQKYHTLQIIPTTVS